MAKTTERRETERARDGNRPLSFSFISSTTQKRLMILAFQAPAEVINGGQRAEAISGSELSDGENGKSGKCTDKERQSERRGSKKMCGQFSRHKQNFIEIS